MPYIKTMKSYSKFNSEKALTNYIIKGLNEDSNGDVFAYKRHGGGMSNEKGKPDITGCVRGIRFEFEIKDPARLNNVQESILSELEEKWKDQGLRGLGSLYRVYGFYNLHELNEKAFEALLPIASKLQQVWIRKFKQVGCVSGVVCSPVQILLACTKIREIHSGWMVT